MQPALLLLRLVLGVVSLHQLGAANSQAWRGGPAPRRPAPGPPPPTRGGDGHLPDKAGGAARDAFRPLSLPNAHPVRHFTKPDSRRYQGALLTKRDLDTSASGSGRTARVDQSKKLHDLAREDPVSAILQHIEEVQTRRNCSENTPLFKDYEKLNESYERFSPQMTSAVRLANVLNNLFRVWDTAPMTLYNDDFYYSLVRAMVEKDENVFGCAIAFDKAQYSSRDFCPYVYKDKLTGKLRVKELANSTRGRYASEAAAGYEWFWKLRGKNFSNILWDHRKSCVDQKSRTAEERANVSLVLSSRTEGMWTRPYYDCTGSRSWMVTYSVPFFGCTAGDDLRFK